MGLDGLWLVEPPLDESLPVSSCPTSTSGPLGLKSGGPWLYHCRRSYSNDRAGSPNPSTFNLFLKGEKDAAMADIKYLQTIGCLLFPGFQSLDILWPLDAFNTLSRALPLSSICIISHTLDPVFDIGLNSATSAAPPVG